MNNMPCTIWKPNFQCLAPILHYLPPSNWQLRKYSNNKNIILHFQKWYIDKSCTSSMIYHYIQIQDPTLTGASVTPSSKCQRSGTYHAVIKINWKKKAQSWSGLQMAPCSQEVLWKLVNQFISCKWRGGGTERKHDKKLQFIYITGQFISVCMIFSGIIPATKKVTKCMYRVKTGPIMPPDFNS
jgi:hypothetical protein